jgi:hypothetical protein
MTRSSPKSDLLVATAVFVRVAVAIYHTDHQIRLFSRIRANAVIDAFRLEPLYALSDVTARTG